MPLLELTPGQIICLHIPHGSHDVAEGLERELLQLAGNQDKTAAVSRPAEASAPESQDSLVLTSAQWLARTAGISEEEGKQIIEELREPVARELAYNAGTPRCLLGLAATLIRRPGV